MQPTLPQAVFSAALFPALALLLAACEPATGPGPYEERVVGVLAVAGDTAAKAVVVPDSARAGAELRVTVTTVGGGCDRGGEMEVEMRGLVAVLVPYDYTQRERDGTCPSVVQRFPRTATLRFAQPGNALIRVQGRRIGPDTPPGGVPIQVEKSVTVR